MEAGGLRMVNGGTTVHICSLLPLWASESPEQAHVRVRWCSLLLMWVT